MELILFIFIFFILIFLNCQIGFAMLISSFFYLLFRGNIPLTIIPERITAGIYTYSLLAIPLFTLAGSIMNQVGITKKIFNFCLAFVGHLKGGLAYVNVLASMIFAGISGSATADAAGLGLVELKAMKEDGYDDSYSVAVTSVSSCIGPIIPPSIVMILIGVVADVSIGRLFIAGILPGILMGLAIMAIIYYHSITQYGKKYFPKNTHPKLNSKERLKALLDGLPSLLSPVIILGGIFMGVITPTEAGVIAVVYSLVLGVIYKELNLKILFKSLEETVNIIGMVMFVVVAAQIFGWVITIERIGFILINYLQSGMLPTWAIWLIIDISLILAGCFIEGLAIILIFLPVFLPLVKFLGIDLVQFGVVFAICVEIGLLTPPLGMSVFVTCNIAGIPVEKGFSKSLIFTIPLIVVLLLTTYLPQISLYLPKLIFGKY